MTLTRVLAGSGIGKLIAGHHSKEGFQNMYPLSFLPEAIERMKFDGHKTEIHVKISTSKRQGSPLRGLD
jgi:hypothetical protein